jgi:hypothetical protein
VLLVATVLALGATMAVHSPFRYPWFLYEFRGDLYTAGRAIVDQQNPYWSDFVARQATLKRTGRAPQTAFAIPVYPPPALLATVPFALLPFSLSATLYLFLSIVALMLAMRLLGVRDVRCLGLMVATVPVLHTLIVGAAEPPIVLGTALAWRWRARLWPPAIAVASVVAAKLFAWPVAFWLLVTRRWRTLGLATLLGGLATLVASSVIGFDAVSDYPHLLSNLAFVEQDVGVSLVGGLRAVGATVAVAHSIVVGVTGALLIAAWLSARLPDGDRRSLAIVVMAALIASPIAWPHYFTLVFIPIALVSPRLSPIWFVPLLAWFAPGTQMHGHLLQILPYLTMDAILVAWLCRPVRRFPRLPSISQPRASEAV